MLTYPDSDNDISTCKVDIKANILQILIDYLFYHQLNPIIIKEETNERRTDDIIPWDAQLIGQVDQQTLFDLILSSHYLEIKPLLDLTCKTVANMIKGKTPQEIRKLFNIKNDFTPEEEEQVRKENAWCEETV